VGGCPLTRVLVHQRPTAYGENEVSFPDPWPILWTGVPRSGSTKSHPTGINDRFRCAQVSIIQITCLTLRKPVVTRSRLASQILFFGKLAGRSVESNFSNEIARRAIAEIRPG
jgi:hypothetical protein